MPTITKRGRDLARCLAPFIGESDRVPQICSLIARLARTHCRLQEISCSDHELTPAEQKREAQIEARIRQLVASLPERIDSPHGKGTLSVEFQGDPRGYTVKIVVPGDRGGNTWGLDGRYGV